MQVRVVGGDGLTANDAFNALIYRPPDETLINYLNSNIQRASELVGATASRFVETAKAMYNKFNNSSIINAGKALIYGVGQHTNQNVIIPMSYDNMGNANLIMQQYIMAHPVVNQMYQDNMCHGFESTYFDMEPGIYGKDRNDYNRVMDGALQFDEDGKGFISHFTCGDDVEDLDSMDKFAIRETWLNVDRLLADNIDPTDPDRGEL